MMHVRLKLRGAFVLAMFCSAPLAVAHADDAVEIQINFPKEEALGTIHVRGTINAPAAAIWKVVTNIHRWTQWMPMVTEARFFSDAAVQALPANPAKDPALFETLRQQHPGSAPIPGDHGVTTRMSYEAYNLPWPIKDEWVIRRYRFDASRAGESVYRVTWEKGYERNEPGSDGYWELAPTREDPQQTVMIYHFRVKAKHGLALALLKAGTKSAVTKFYHSIREEVLRVAAKP